MGTHGQKHKLVHPSRRSLLSICNRGRIVTPGYPACDLRCKKYLWDRLSLSKYVFYYQQYSKNQPNSLIFVHHHVYSGPGSSVGIANGWTVRGSNLGVDEIFRTRSDRPWGPPSLLYNGYRVFSEGKAAGAWC
jgi:hypothetical protein